MNATCLVSDEDFSIYEIAAGGSLVRSPLFATTGSGSNYLLTFLGRQLSAPSNNQKIMLSPHDENSSSSTEIVENDKSDSETLIKDSSHVIFTRKKFPNVEKCVETIRYAIEAVSDLDPRTGAEIRLWKFNKPAGFKRIYS